MTVQELIEQLKTFDGDLSVVVVDLFDTEIPQQIKTTRWEFDSKCKIIIDSHGN